MSDHALWEELMRTAQAHLQDDAPEAVDHATHFRRVARCLALCARIGVEHPRAELLERDRFEAAELEDFFRKTWRMAAMHAEQDEVAQLEARRGVDQDAADFKRLRALLSEARGMILDFGWLSEPAKRRHLDQLEALQSQLQRARDDFDVAMRDVRDPDIAAAVEIGRPTPLSRFWRNAVALFGPAQVDEDAPPRAERKALPPLRPDDHA